MKKNYRASLGVLNYFQMKKFRFFAVPLVLVLLFSFIVFANNKNIYTETMAARETIKHEDEGGEDEGEYGNAENSFPFYYGDGVMGHEAYMNAAIYPKTEGKKGTESEDSALAGCGTCGSAAKWQGPH